MIIAMLADKLDSCHDLKFSSFNLSQSEINKAPGVFSKCETKVLHFFIRICAHFDRISFAYRFHNECTERIYVKTFVEGLSI